MAQSGFPWLAAARTQDTAELDEKKGIESSGRISPSNPLSNLTNKSPPKSPQSYGKRHTHLHGKRRAGSLKSQQPVRPMMKSDIQTRSNLRDGPDRLPVRTIPAWVRDAEEDDLQDEAVHLPDTPGTAFVAHHNHSPSVTQRPLLFDSQPTRNGGYPTSSGKIRPERTSRWISFARASAYPRETFNGEKVDEEWLNTHFTDYSKPWLADHNEDDEDDGASRYRAFRKKRQVWYKRAQFTILRNPFIPLMFRIMIISFAIMAIGLGASIFHETGKIVDCTRQPVDSRTEYCAQLLGPGAKDYYRDPSALMAIIVDVIAVIYSIYITYDEYFSKPLGLRPARAKVRLVLLDLFFIVFQAANLSLSFESLTVDEGACQVGDDSRTAGRFDNVCDRAQALCSVLLLSLVAWLLTFSVSILRLVERINVR